MKKLTFLLIVIVFSLTAHAKVWRVNNIAGFNADFTNFTAAQAAASANDTLYFEGSTTSYGNIVLAKPFVIVGPGYFLTENPQTQANSVSSTFGSITFNTGSSESVVTGLVVTGNIDIKVGNIVIESNNIIAKISIINSASTIGNIFITKNFIQGEIQNSSGNTLYNLYNVIITNNFVLKSVSFDLNCSGTISNNCFNYDYMTGVSVHNFIIKNNISNHDYSVPLDNIISNNIGSETQFPIGNGNQQNVIMSDVFVSKTGNSTDGQFQLKPYSPALGAGNDGKDCGMFGGESPYVLSGLPSIPAIYEVIMPATGTSNSGINVTIKAKTH